MLWDWGWTWKNIDVQGAKIAIDASDTGSAPDPNTGRVQGTGVRFNPSIQSYFLANVMAYWLVINNS